MKKATEVALGGWFEGGVAVSGCGLRDPFAGWPGQV